MTDSEFFVQQMSTWFSVYARDLLWRHDVTPYRVWVSEIMLQQTQVATVTPYFERWMRELPTIESLAAADEAKVLSLWAGLGYYRRARYLHKGAQYVVDVLHGVFPDNLQELKKIPGVGAYTAGAIASMALKLDVAAIDGNVERVLGRYFAIRGDLKAGDGRKQLESKANEVAACGRAGLINQAMMDLGASLCGRVADCAHCPVSARCQACLQQLTHVIPQPAAKLVKAQSWRAALVLVDAEQRVLVARRRDDVLLGGLWSFPMIDLCGELPKTASEAKILARASRTSAWNAWLRSHGFVCKLGRCASNGEFVRHIFTHIDMHVTLDVASIDRPLVVPTEFGDDPEFVQFDVVELNNAGVVDADHPVSTLMNKLMSALKTNP